MSGDIESNLVLDILKWCIVKVSLKTVNALMKVDLASGVDVEIKLIGDDK